ncbi:succinate dehydrogenase/fumarate reductase iron-sulfur subunit [Sulfurimonas lithotrophica]|uniref:Fumarate reductase iron-sulfur subunit n=1 Tax=Sulfurimonas lithotrophica TaxID=2590022 RepID=A0A5P8P3S8_9BACT|nr:2Fe-2S iron-sulfur cluster-binding protein [Sulfurimonas lithotrophica]QFR50344.1 succinate dehydrogenase/fumarate reductase iron-sulfur subunit [Sulfurimonas lithotrophica]
MNIKIKRDELVEYNVSELKGATLLETLNYIKTKIDPTLTYSSGCRSSVCGSCAVRVNEKEVLACSYKVQEGDVIEPLKNVEVIRDLVVNMDKAYEFNAKSKAWINKSASTPDVTQENEKLNEVQSDCILCASCYSACPVYAVNPEFKGPFSLTRVYKYVSDVRDSDAKEKIDVIQTNGIWDCTLCNECTMVCPQDISSKADIEKLRMKSTQYGYMDPNFGSFDGGLDFL